MPQKTSNFAQLMEELHNENQRLVHFARRGPKGAEFSTMPVTAFVYEFFLYNTVYQVDWRISTQKGLVSYHRGGKRGKKEHEQQNDLESFLRERDKTAKAFTTCFEPLRGLKLQGVWTEINPDDRITAEEAPISSSDCATSKHFCEANTTMSNACTAKSRNAGISSTK